MRMIVLFILLSLGAEGQIIRGQMYYVPMPSAGQLLLDAYPNAAAAYSLRKLKSSYSGSAIRVRRSSDNTEQDIGFVGNNLDTAGMKTFVGANSGFVTTWYDQSGNARNATQTTAANQPSIITSGVIERKDGDIGLFFNRTNSNFLITAYSDVNGFSVFMAIHTIGNNNTNDRLGIFHNAVFELGRLSASYGFRTMPTDAAVVTTSPSVVQYVTGSSSFSANSSYIAYGGWAGNNTVVRFRRNGIDNANSSTSGSTMRTQSTTPAYYTGYFYEAIIYPDDQYSDRIGIETNINNYYGLY